MTEPRLYEDARPKSKKILLLVIGIPLLAVGLGSLLLARSFWALNSAAGGLQKAINDAKKAGLAVTADQLESKPKSAPKYLQSALSRYRAATQNHVYGGMALYDKSGIFAGPELDRVLIFITPALADLEKTLAEERELYSYGYDWNLGPVVGGAQLYEVDGLTIGFCIRGFRKIRAGDWEGGLHDLETVERLAKRSSEVPCYIGMEAAYMIERNRLATILMLAKVYANDAEKLERLAKEIEASIDNLDPSQAIRGIIFANVSILRNFDLLGSYVGYTSSSIASTGTAYAPARMVNPYASMPPEFAGQLNRNEKPIKIGDQAYMARYLERVLPYWNRYKRGQSEWSLLSDAWMKHTVTLSKSSDRFDRMITRLDNAFSPLDTWSRLRAKQIAILAILKALTYREKNGSWPTSIEDLPGKFIDPYTNKPMLTTVKAGRFRVYSVGLNLTDDGGYTEDEVMSGKSRGDDITVAYPPAGYP